MYLAAADEGGETVFPKVRVHAIGMPIHTHPIPPLFVCQILLQDGRQALLI